MELNKEIKIFQTDSLKDYELLDTGDGEKLERFGKYTFVRPCEDAMWPKTLNKNIWEDADGKFYSSKKGAKPGWVFKNKLPKSWVISYKGIKFHAAPTPFRHLSFFPEQASHWDFIHESISKAKKPVKFLNLFGYTGVASLVALSAGAEVTHLDASKQSLKLAKENETLSGLSGMRIIEDDAIKFLEREVKRGNKYDAIIMDPPKFGRGPKGEVWKLEESLPKLLSLAAKVLSEKPLFVIVTSYATDISSVTLKNTLENTMKGQAVAGEMCVKEKSSGKLIPLANTTVLKK